jgi:2-keto-3-deoxy-6-phosphogluconate aldolase
MKKAEVRTRIQEIGIIPGIRVATREHAGFAAEAVKSAGNGAGAGTVLDIETARRCLEAGGVFLTGTGLVSEVVEFALKNDIVVFPGAMTPTDPARRYLRIVKTARSQRD